MKHINIKIINPITCKSEQDIMIQNLYNDLMQICENVCGIIISTNVKNKKGYRVCEKCGCELHLSEFRTTNVYNGIEHKMKSCRACNYKDHPHEKYLFNILKKSFYPDSDILLEDEANFLNRFITDEVLNDYKIIKLAQRKLTQFLNQKQQTK